MWDRNRELRFGCGRDMTNFTSRGKSQPWTKLAPVEQNPERPEWHRSPRRPGHLSAFQPAFAVTEVSSHLNSTYFSIRDLLGYVWIKDLKNATSRWKMVTGPDSEEHTIQAISQMTDGLFGITNAGKLFYCELETAHWSEQRWKVPEIDLSNLWLAIVSLSASENGLVMGVATGHLLAAHFNAKQPPSEIDFIAMHAPPDETGQVVELQLMCSVGRHHGPGCQSRTGHNRRICCPVGSRATFQFYTGIYHILLQSLGRTWGRMWWYHKSYGNMTLASCRDIDDLLILVVDFQSKSIIRSRDITFVFLSFAGRRSQCMKLHMLLPET